MYLTNFFSEKSTYTPRNKKKIRKLIELICKDQNKSLVFLNCIFCSDNYLLEINRKYLKHNFYTDVITFDHREKENKSIEGDVYISVDRVKENAKSYGVKTESELIRVIIHGVLHLCGFGDKNKKEKKIMGDKENKYISLYNNI